MTRTMNFNPGPSSLPLPVLEEVKEELLDFAGTGMSVLECSHRSPEYDAVHEAAQKRPQGAAGPRTTATTCSSWAAARRPSSR